MPSVVEIANLALSHIGVGKEIANIDTEKSEEAAAMRRYYTPARDEVLREYSWPFATQFVSLGLVAEDPTDEWNFSYRYPSDCIYFRRILSGVRNDTRQSRVPHKIARDVSGLLILTDQENAKAEYTIREEDPQRFPADFVMALSYRLAAYVARRLSGGDPFKLGEFSLRLYQISLSKAQSTAENEGQIDEPPESEFIRTRE